MLMYCHRALLYQCLKREIIPRLNRLNRQKCMLRHSNRPNRRLKLRRLSRMLNCHFMD